MSLTDDAWYEAKVVIDDDPNDADLQRRQFSNGAREFRVNSLRDAAQHHFVELSEAHLAIHMMAGMTLFRDIAKDACEQDITDELPTRALAVSTTPPLDLTTLFADEAGEVRKLLQPGTRLKLEARARLRGLAIVEGAVSARQAGSRY